MRVLLTGATGTIGQAAARALRANGHDVVGLVRPNQTLDIPGVRVLAGEVSIAEGLPQATLDMLDIDAVVSCLASRTGVPEDAWRIDHDAQLRVLGAAERAGARHFVLLSAICVQKPDLAFQHAKLAFEKTLMSSGMTWSIVRPTAFFKSLSGQVARVQAGKPFVMFGDGTHTACKPISDRDLGAYLAQCLSDPSLHNRILPIGGPGPAITPREQGEALFRMLGQTPRFKRVPFGLMDAIVGGLSLVGRISRKAADKAEFARIGRYYATESMLLWNETSGHYDADATPETGQDTLWDHYAALLRGEAKTQLRDHAVFGS